jgi:HSP20 family molecular chaperone IbpA
MAKIEATYTDGILHVFTEKRRIKPAKEIAVL